MEAQRLGPDAGARCLVIGGCGGIGRAYVEGLLASSARVAVLDVALSLQKHAVPAGVLAHPVDVTDHASLNGAVRSVGEAWGGLDVLAYVSGINLGHDRVEAASLEAVRAVIDVNLIGAFAASQAAMPFLRQSASAVMLFVSSGLSMNAEQGFGAYAASKGGMNALVKVLAKEGGPTVRVNAIAPGLVETAFLSGGTAAGHASRPAEDFFNERGDKSRGILASITLGRVAQPADIAEPMLFLTGRASRFMTGQIVHVNGGRFTP